MHEAYSRPPEKQPRFQQFDKFSGLWNLLNTPGIRNIPRFGRGDAVLSMDEYAKKQYSVFNSAGGL